MMSPRLLIGLMCLLMCLAVLVSITPTGVEAQRVGPGGAPPPGSGPAEVTGFVRVIDGETIETLVDGKLVGIGLIGIEAPMGNTDCGRAATQQLQQLLTLARGRGGIRLEEEPTLPFDARKRRMYYVQERTGRSLIRELVGGGVSRANGFGKEAVELAAAEADARAVGRGCLWNRPSADARPSADNLLSAGTGDAVFAKMDFEDGIAAMARSSVAPVPGVKAAAAAPLATTLPSGFAEDVVAGGLNSPTALAFLPDGRILIAQKSGTVVVYKNGAVLPTPFVDIRARVNDYWDHGLLGIAADPNFAANGYVYLLYTYEDSAAQYNSTKTAQLIRVTASGDAAMASSAIVLLGKTVGSSCNAFPSGTDCLPSDSPSHSIGSVKFAADGSLFVSVGDAASFTVVDDDALRAQNLDLLAGKVLHVATDGSGRSDNPFWTGNAGDNRSKVWAYGLRNPLRLNLQPSSGVPYLGDVGWDNWEEINVATKGANLGWPCFEGNDRQAGYEPKATCQALYNRGAAAVKPPLVVWGHNGSSAASIGGTFYTGTAFPAEYQGALFYADYGRNVISYVKVDANHNLVGAPIDFATGAGGPVDLEMGPDGNLYYVSIGTAQLRRFRSVGALPPLACAAGQYLAEYFNNQALSGTPTFQQCEPAPLDKNWPAGTGPGGGVGTDNFSVRWTGTFGFPAGTQTFSATTDDGVRVWVDGALLIDQWRDQGTATFTAQKDLPAGDHQVKVEYYEGGGDAVAKLAWQGSGTTNRPPVAAITAPSSTLTYKVGDVISYTGSANDPEDGAIPPSRLAWQVVIHHCPGGTCHDHPFASGTGAGGSFTVPDHGDDSYFELILTATDSTGQTGTASVNIRPQTVRITLTTVPSGLQVIYGGAAATAPLTQTTVVNSQHTITAPSPQGGAVFTSWSDGGAAQHNITVGTADVTYTATFAGGGTTSCAAGQYLAEYYANMTLAGTPARTGCEAAPLAADWGPGSPAGLPGDGFSARWTGQFSFSAGTYTFSAVADDGMRVWLDGTLVSDEWRDQHAAYQFTRAMTAGNHQVKVEYYENGGDASAKLDWQLAGPADTTPPTVTSTSPAAGAVGAAATANATATFSEAMDPASITGATFTLKDAAGAAVAATVAYDATAKVATLDPTPSLVAGATYTATVNGGASGAKDLAGNPLATDKAWSFTVAATADTTPPIISNVTVPGNNVTSTSVTVTWTTDEAADSQVEYGLTTAYGLSTVVNPVRVTGHSQELSGLRNNTVYHYRVKSRDAAGNLATSPDLTFRTKNK